MVTSTTKSLKNFTYNLALLTTFIIIWGFSSPEESKKSNTLFLENNGFKLIFNDKGLKVTNSKGEYVILNSRGVEISNLKAYNTAKLFNNEGKILVNMYERDYPNNRGKGGEVDVYSNYEGGYSGLRVAGNIDQLFESIKSIKSRNSSRNSVGKVCMSCYGKGYRKNTAIGGNAKEQCTVCDGTGRIFD